MLIFNLKKEWFEKIKSGEKTHEYREVKPYWTKRIKKARAYLNTMTMLGISCTIDCIFRLGYSVKNELYGSIKSINIVDGKNTDLKIDKSVYDIEFELIKN